MAVGIKTFLLLLLISTQAFAMSRPMGTYISCKDEGPVVKSNGGPKSIFTDEQISEVINYSREEEKLRYEKLFPFPKFYMDIFLNNKDISPELINTTAQSSFERWSKEKSSDYKYSGFDFDGFRELNLQAHKIWKEMIACNKSDLGQMRQNYFMVDPCGKDNPSNATVSTEISQLNSSLALFALTSEEIGEGTPPSNGLRLPVIHPLLAQLLLQQFSVTLNMNIEPERNEIILWERYQTYRNNPVFQKELLPYMNLFKYLNNITILTASIGQENSCVEFGLYPVMNSVIMQTMSTIMLHDSARNWAAFSTSQLGNNMFHKAEVCGTDAQFFSNTQWTFYSANAYTHLNQMRRLTMTYYPERMDDSLKGFLRQQGMSKNEKFECR